MSRFREGQEVRILRPGVYGNPYMDRYTGTTGKVVSVSPRHVRLITYDKAVYAYHNSDIALLKPAKQLKITSRVRI